MTRKVRRPALFWRNGFWEFGKAYVAAVITWIVRVHNKSVCSILHSNENQVKEHKWMYYKRDSGYSNQVFLSKYPGNGLKSVQRGTGTNSQAGSQTSLQPFFRCHAALSSKERVRLCDIRTDDCEGDQALLNRALTSVGLGTRETSFGIRCKHNFH